jgi:hypothetical protein
VDDFVGLKSLGLDLPSPGYPWGAIVSGLVGRTAVRRVRHSGRPRTWWFYAVGAALCAVLALERE